MIKFTSISTSEILESNRFDAEYFHPEMIKAIELINSRENTHLSNYTKFIKKGCFDMPPSNYTDERNSIPFIRSGDMKNIFVNDNVVCITKEAHAKELKTELQKKDLILSKIGTIGDIGINLKWDKINCSQNTIAIKIKDSFKGISPFLAVYINSYYGQIQLKRSSQGQVQEKLILEDLKNLLIVDFSLNLQSEISNLVEESFNLLEQSKKEINDAQYLLLEEIELNDRHSNEPQITFSKKYSSIIEAERMDAEYFQPKYERIVNAITDYHGGYDILDNFVIIKKGFEVGSDEYSNEGIPFTRVSNLNPFEISEEKRISEQLYNELAKKYQPKKGEILLSKDATPGIAHYLRNEPKKMIASSGMLRLKKSKSSQMGNECLALILNSILTQEQMKRDVGGSVILHWRPEQIKKILIPILPKTKQLMIKENFLESLNLHDESKQLLEIAKRVVEIAIEKNEKEALKWLDSQGI